jgi:hypothetical protein
MVAWFEEKEEWDQIERSVRNQFVRKVQEGKVRDRERKRKKIAPLFRWGVNVSKMSLSQSVSAHHTAH